MYSWWENVKWGEKSRRDIMRREKGKFITWKEFLMWTYSNFLCIWINDGTICCESKYVCFNLSPWQLRGHLSAPYGDTARCSKEGQNLTQKIASHTDRRLTPKTLEWIQHISTYVNKKICSYAFWVSTVQYRVNIIASIVSKSSLI